MKTCYFISPHFDDAVFSCGGLMLQLLAKKYQVVVITVFTQSGSPPQTLSAKQYLKQIGYNSVEEVYLAREKEDKTVLDQMGCTTIRLGLVEALWRKNVSPSYLSRILGTILPEFLHVYPTYRFHIIKKPTSTLTDPITQEITLALKQSIAADSLVFCPVGLGGHVDHLVVKKACEDLNYPLVYWADIPYKVRNTTETIQSVTGESQVAIVDDQHLLQKKQNFAMRYATQYDPVFGAQDCSAISEEYVSPKNYSKLAELFKQ